MPKAQRKLMSVLKVSLSLRLLQVLTPDSQALLNLSENEEKKKQKFCCLSIKTRTPALRSQKKSPSQVKFTWMRCTLAWVALASRSPMKPQALTTRAIYMICLSPSHQSRQHSRNALHLRRASFRQMTSDLKSSSSLQTVGPMKKKIQNPIVTYTRVAIALSATIFLTTNLSLTNSMTVPKFSPAKRF